MRHNKIKESWKRFRESSSFRNIIVYIMFVGIAALFWFIMAMNDSVTRTIDVALRIGNVPDSVTFITVPPHNFHVTVRDKGTNLMRSGLMRRPVMEIDFRDFAENGYFRFTSSDMNTALKSSFGNSAQIASVSLDSLMLTYTSGKGKQLPVDVNADVTTAAGFVLRGRPYSEVGRVKVYSLNIPLDTMMKVVTRQIVKRNLTETLEIEVALQPIAGVRMIPDKVKVKIPVEPLVKKEAWANVVAMNVPEGKDLIFFPGKVQVTYYVPMSQFNSHQGDFEVYVEYADIFKSGSDNVKINLDSHPRGVVNPELSLDSVQYSLINE